MPPALPRRFHPVLLAMALGLAACPSPRDSLRGPEPALAARARPSPEVIAAAKAALLAKVGEGQRARIERGVDQVAALWQAEDGELAAFVTEQFAATPAELDALFARFEAQLEQVDGLVQESQRALRWHSEVDTGPMLPIDPLFASVDPGAHVVADLFASKVAFVALLNFPLTSLADRLRDAGSYSRRQWAEVRLTGRFNTRIPGDVAAAVSAAESAADAYIAGYNLWMHHVLGEDGQRRFPLGKRLISHWNLRDELKANYADADGLAKQRTIVKVMERIVTQTIPAAVINNPRLDWNPFTNAVTPTPAAELEADAPKATPAADGREADTRFAYVLAHFAAARAADAYSPTAPSHLARAFDRAEMPEERVRALIVSVLSSPHVAAAAQEIARRLGRPLGPQDLWYEFGGGDVPEAEYDALTRKRYPTAKAFAADLPRILGELGFPPELANTLATHIAVDPSRGAGHAMGAQRRGDLPHLRTRVETGGMDYKGYNIAVHELGHNVEQYLSLYEVDHTLLAGVPNTAFTEALAFLFQARDLQLLGRPAPGAEAERLRVLDHFWNTWEIAGSALVEIDVWHWLYEHPNATAAELREATGEIARATWDRYYAPVLGGAGETSLLGIYSHTIASPLYLFNYVLGHAIAFQLEEHVAGKDAKTFAAEFARASRFGAVLPDTWMAHATGAPVSAESLLAATGRALATR
ncbi:MAG: hypothetical protein R3B48_00075 [Kofleriaceae bacterium]